MIVRIPILIGILVAFSKAAGHMALNGPRFPIRNAESVFELSYIAQLAPWWTLQPDIQYIVRPGGNVPHPIDGSKTAGNAFIVGARSTISF